MKWTIILYLACLCKHKLLGEGYLSSPRFMSPIQGLNLFSWLRQLYLLEITVQCSFCLTICCSYRISLPCSLSNSHVLLILWPQTAVKVTQVGIKNIWTVYLLFYYLFISYFIIFSYLFTLSFYHIYMLLIKVVLKSTTFLLLNHVNYMSAVVTNLNPLPGVATLI